MSKSEHCSHCGQRIPLTRKELLNKHKADMLKRAAAHVIDRYNAGEEDANDFMVRDFTEDGDFKRFNFFSHLRLHGLIFRQRDINGNDIRGRWGITRLGWSFLRGMTALPAYVLIKNNHIEGRADELVLITQVLKGDSSVQTQFEYFDDDGKPVGLRPMQPPVTPSRQERLL